MTAAPLTAAEAMRQLADERTGWRPRHNHGQMLLLLTSGRPQRKQVR